MTKKVKQRCKQCGHTDFKYGSSLLFKTAVTCVKCGNSWHEGRTTAAQERYRREIYDAANQPIDTRGER